METRSPRENETCNASYQYQLWTAAETEVNRFKTYLWVDTRSPIASPIFIAAKATASFIRICGDYVAINKYMKNGHYPIPNVQHELQKIIN